MSDLSKDEMRYLMSEALHSDDDNVKEALKNLFVVMRLSNPELSEKYKNRMALKDGLLKTISKNSFKKKRFKDKFKKPRTIKLDLSSEDQGDTDA